MKTQCLINRRDIHDPADASASGIVTYVGLGRGLIFLHNWRSKTQSERFILRMQKVMWRDQTLRTEYPFGDRRAL